MEVILTGEPAAVLVRSFGTASFGAEVFVALTTGEASIVVCIEETSLKVSHSDESVGSEEETMDVVGAGAGSGGTMGAEAYAGVAECCAMAA